MHILQYSLLPLSTILFNKIVFMKASYNLIFRNFFMSEDLLHK